MAQIPATAKRHPMFHTIACDVDGTIYSIKTGRPRKLWRTRHGYLQLAVRRTSYLAHRLIADAHIPNPEKKPKVNHKNGIKHDNSVTNLEWCTQLENVRHARDVLGVKYGRSGFQNPNARLLESHQTILANLHARGFSLVWIAEVMGFALPTIRMHLREITKRADSL